MLVGENVTECTAEYSPSHFLDYFLWGYVKSHIYIDKLQSIDVLEANITRVINGIPADMLERVLENCPHRTDHVRTSCREHLNEIIFKYYMS